MPVNLSVPIRLRPSARTLLAIVAAHILAACAPDTTAPVAVVPVATVEITTSRAELVVGESHDFDAVPKSATGAILRDRAVVWQSENEAVASISAAGVLLAKSGGAVGIVATSEGRSTRFVVNVLVPNPVPVLQAITPATINAGITTNFTVIVRGEGFTDASRVRWNDLARPSEYVSPTELRMTVTPNDVAEVGARAVTVVTPGPGGGASAALIFTVEQPAPVITTVAPSQIVAGWGMPFTVVLTGTGFTGATQLFVDDQPRAIEQRTATTIAFRLAPTDVAGARQISIRVGNAAPGGGSATAAFEVLAVPAASLSIELPYEVAWTWAGIRLPLNAVVRSATNRELPDRLVTWGVQSQAVASVTPTGLQGVAVFGNNPGVTTVSAKVDDITTYAQVKVYATPAFDVMYSGGVLGSRHIRRWDIATNNLPRRLNLGMEAMYPAPAPDGAHFAFIGLPGTSAQTDLYVARADGSDVRQLTSDNASDVYPAWSPDGSRIAWVSSRSSGLNIYTARPDGSDVQQLTFARFDDPLPGSGQVATRPSWSPDGRHIVYTVGVNNRSQLWVMNAQGHDKRRLTAPANADDYEPTWSADGRTIAFRRVSRTFPQTSLMRVDAETGAEINNLWLGQIPFAGTPSFSPDGNWLIMSSDVASDAPALYGMPAKEMAQGARPLWPLTLTGGVRDAVWIKR
ncbi:Ig-like domain-containing protein [Gemmatimonas groenlandica]|uniref:BIG2 domain-containing protein n=1 Tax=Gemmatimonas groenlandica TaxID=2732249 RepID=A0A6M4IP32_9BACT|nr:Ig-like domain-containing protein [Gemmatimonas groenlandica]QJR35785.1 hypothetical protein HKW67_09800 [Gemmatimonas groenlandica]